MPTKPNYLPNVKQQYEDYPYPMRNPLDEKKFLTAPLVDCLDYMNHFAFEGKRDFTKNFRVLVAGGGTGDTVIFLAEQLRDTEAEIVYVDLSSASMNIAKERAKVRDLNNIEWYQASLLDVATLDIGLFDYINCSGVLHHLEDPDKGLAALNSVLAEGGAMGIMVYGQYGRTGVYQMQELMRLIGEDDPIEERILDCKKILGSIPNTNWYKYNAHLGSDIRKYGDIGIYDVFLHSQDRAYTIPELYEYADKQGLNILRILSPHTYNLDAYVQDQELLKQINNKDEITRYAIGELFTGSAIKHTCYMSRKPKNQPSANDESMVPCLPIVQKPDAYTKLQNIAQSTASKAISFKSENMNVNIQKTPELLACISELDGKNSIGEIYSHAESKSGINKAVLQKPFEEFLDRLIRFELMFLRHKNTPPYTHIDDLQKRIQQ